MYKNKKIAALITARGGSKRIPGKNLVKLCGKPLIHWTIESALGSGYIDKIFLSSDSDEIINSVKKYPVEIPFVRPKSLASGKTSSSKVILHFIDWTKKVNMLYDVLLLLQPTSPFRKAEHIDKAINKFFSSKDALSLVSVGENPKNSFHLQKKKSKNYPENLYTANKKNSEHENLKTYFINGAIYLMGVKDFEKYETFETPKTLCYIMPFYSSLDIDTTVDLKMAEYYYTQKLV